MKTVFGLTAIIVTTLSLTSHAADEITCSPDDDLNGKVICTCDRKPGMTADYDDPDNTCKDGGMTGEECSGACYYECRDIVIIGRTPEGRKEYGPGRTRKYKADCEKKDSLSPCKCGDPPVPAGGCWLGKWDRVHKFCHQGKCAGQCVYLDNEDDSAPPEVVPGSCHWRPIFEH